MGEIRVLQAGRAFAALAVVAHHAGGATVFAPGTPQWLSAVLGYGYLGVDFFFVLSGFIIYHISSAAMPSLQWLRRFSLGRLKRIFIPYLPIGIGIALIYTFLPGLSAGDREWGWLATLTLAPTPTDPALIVAWTLQHELIFYAVFALGFFWRRPILVVAVWSFASLAFDYGVVLASINVEFLFGVLAARLVTVPKAAWLGMLSLPVLAAYVALGAEASNRILFALAMAFALVPIVQLDRKITTPGWLMFLGAASYSIYLIHNPVMSVVARLADNWAIVLVASATSGVLAGLAYHVWFERLLVSSVRSKPSASDGITAERAAESSKG